MMIWRSLALWFRRLLRGFRSQSALPTLYRVAYDSELPEEVSSHTLVAVGEDEHLWYAVLKCPCGCGDLLQLSLLENERPRWRLNVQDDVPTLAPSVWRHRGCQSHFVLRDGVVRWCSEPSNLTPEHKC